MKTLKSKRQIKIADGDTYLDLIGVSFKPMDETRIKNYILVDEELAGRADLISFFAYGSRNYADLLMKFNGISNPFSIEIGDIILVPDATFIENSVMNVKDIKRVQNRKIQKIETNSDKLPKVDEKRIERLKKIAEKFPNASKNFDSPNRLEDGESNVIKRNDLLFFQ